MPEGFQLCYFARCGVNDLDGDGPHIEDYNHAKRQLTFCRLSQDGTGEGIFFLGQLPTDAEAAVIRDVFGILRRKHYTDEQLASMRERAQDLRNTAETTSRESIGLRNGVSGMAMPLW